jgi:hypothetical protein
VRWSAWTVGVALVALAGCTTAGNPAPAPPPPTAAPPTAAAPTTAATDALAFLPRPGGVLQAVRRAAGHRRGGGRRFRDAKVVRDLGDGTTEIEDGRGTHLVVDPRRGIVLPASGKQSDVMPPPYGFTCSEKVFVAPRLMIVPPCREPSGSRRPSPVITGTA